MVDTEALRHARTERATAIASSGSIEDAIERGVLGGRIEVTLSEAVVLGLLRQGVSKYLVTLGHGSTELGEVLRIYEEAGLVRGYPCRHETEAAHAATALRWVTGEKAAVVTSIGPGALHAMAGSLASASDGIGVWHIYGDETTHDEGPNMQQIPKHEQGLFLRLCETLGHAYSLHTPAAVGPALRRGLDTVEHPYRAGPFHLLLPLNTQPAFLRDFNVDELPVGVPPRLGPANMDQIGRAAEVLLAGDRVVVKVGGGARDCADLLPELLDLVGGVAVTSPLVSGVIPYGDPRNMTVGGSKGSLCGNWAMGNADTLMVVGGRAVCQSDSSRTGYPRVRQVVNLNADERTAMHYNRTTALVGDARATLVVLLDVLRNAKPDGPSWRTEWQELCAEEKAMWDLFKKARYDHPTLLDPMWETDVLSQPAAIKTVTDWARDRDAVTFFDAGDVQANGFQVVEDDRLGRTFTETGASYMGFAVSALMATGVADAPFYGVACTGDGSFTMNPQVLIDGLAIGATGTIVLFDNRRMGAISSLQRAQYGRDWATSDHVPVDYLAWARSVAGVSAFDGGRSPESLCQALDAARESGGLSLVHVPVYFGDDPLGGLGAWGDWNVGNWVESVQERIHGTGM